MAETIHIQIQNLLLGDKGKAILQIPSAQIPIERITCIVGPNGSGKSSLLKAIAGLYKVPKDTITLPNLSICMVPHAPTVLKMSVKNNLLLLRDAKKTIQEKDVVDTLKKFQLVTFGDRPATQLSSGERQRLNLARAYLLDAELILLDEPTSSLDPLSCQLMEKYIEEMSHEGTRFMIVSHDFYQVKRLSQYIVFLDNNRLKEIISSPAYFQANPSEFFKVSA